MKKKSFETDYNEAVEARGLEEELSKIQDAAMRSLKKRFGSKVHLDSQLSSISVHSRTRHYQTEVDFFNVDFPDNVSIAVSATAYWEPGPSTPITFEWVAELFGTAQKDRIAGTEVIRKNHNVVGGAIAGKIEDLVVRNNLVKTASLYTSLLRLAAVDPQMAKVLTPLLQKHAGKWMQKAIKEPGRVKKHLGLKPYQDVPKARLDSEIRKYQKKVNKTEDEVSLLRAMQLAQRMQKGKLDKKAEMDEAAQVVVEAVTPGGRKGLSAVARLFTRHGLHLADIEDVSSTIRAFVFSDPIATVRAKLALVQRETSGDLSFQLNVIPYFG